MNTLLEQHVSFLQQKCLSSRSLQASHGQELPVQLPQDSGKLTVVLDIDETLIHTELVNSEFIDPSEDSESVFYLKVDGYLLKVTKRPFLDEFLQIASKQFELIAFTAGVEDYATLLLDHLDPHHTIFRHRLFRQHCILRYGNNFIKDLRVVNRDLRRTVLVDNNANSFLFQPSNGVPIASFFNDLSDKALIYLSHFLNRVDEADDVRPVLSNAFNMEGMLKEANARQNLTYVQA